MFLFSIGPDCLQISCTFVGSIRGGGGKNSASTIQVQHLEKPRGKLAPKTKKKCRKEEKQKPRTSESAGLVCGAVSSDRVGCFVQFGVGKFLM